MKSEYLKKNLNILFITFLERRQLSSPEKNPADAYVNIDFRNHLRFTSVQRIAM